MFTQTFQKGTVSKRNKTPCTQSGLEPLKSWFKEGNLTTTRCAHWLNFFVETGIIYNFESAILKDITLLWVRLRVGDYVQLETALRPADTQGSAGHRPCAATAASGNTASPPLAQRGYFFSCSSRPGRRAAAGRAGRCQSDLGWTFGVAWTRALRHAGSGCMLGQWISKPQSFKLSLRFKLPSESSEEATDPVRRARPTRLFKINGFSMEFYRCFPLLWPLFRKNRSTYMLMVHDLFISVDNIFSACWFISMRSFSVTTRTLDNRDKDPPPPCVTEMACVACFWLNLRIILNIFWMIFDF
jgi:hypothetical protein